MYLHPTNTLYVCMCILMMIHITRIHVHIHMMIHIHIHMTIQIHIHVMTHIHDVIASYKYIVCMYVYSYDDTHYTNTRSHSYDDMGWLRLVGSLKL